MPLCWRTRRLTSCGGALVAMLIATPALAQQPVDYDRLVDAYATGHLDEAVSQLSRWPSEQVKGAVGLFVKAIQAQTASVTAPLSSRRLRAAVMLHTDLAAASLGTDFSLAEFHVNAARRLIDVLASRAPHDPRAREFITHWYEFAPSLFLVVRKLDRATWLVQEGFDKSPNNPTLHTYKGIIEEMRGPVQATVVARGRELALSPARAERALEPATQEFRLALKADSRFALARLRLGRIHFLADDNRARGDLEQALADATDASTQYLAHLFLGEVAASEKRQQDALREYEAAITVGPQYQTGYIAAARMADALGESDRSRELAMACVGIEKSDDPWWDYQVGGVNMPMLQWLRQAAQAS
jgi:tetratricopeptide (TPR) repeat protein